MHQDQAIVKALGFCLKDVGMLGCWVAHPFQMSVCVLKGEGLKNEILSNAYHSSYTVHFGSTKMYKDEERSGLEFRTFLSSSLLQATFGMPHYEALYWDKCWSPSYLGQCWKETTLEPELIKVLITGQRMNASKGQYKSYANN